jgi:predicted DNA-binding mobile mystery protein A
MRVEERERTRKQLDKEMRPFRVAHKQKHPTQELLRAVRQVLGVPMAELAKKAGVNRSVIFRLERSERRGTISLRAMTRVANAMDCTVIYGIVPRSGQTLEEVADWRKWEKRLKEKDRG